MPSTNRSSFSKIPPFYDPGALPSVLPVLIAQTEIVAAPTIKLVSQQEIGSGPSRTRRNSVRFTPYPKVSSRPSPSSSKTKDERCQHETARRGPTPADSTSESDLSESDLSSLPETDSEIGLVPKPNGEAGRPGRGGYNLEEALEWHKKDTERLKKFIKKAVEEHLDPTKSFSSQPLASVNVVRNLASEKFPVLRDYAQCWPVTDFIRLRLKYTSGQARLKADRAAAAVGKRLTRKAGKT